VLALLDKPGLRRELASRQREAVLDFHCGSRWQAALRTTLAALARVPSIEVGSDNRLVLSADGDSVSTLLDLHGQTIVKRDAWTVLASHYRSLRLNPVALTVVASAKALSKAGTAPNSAGAALMTMLAKVS
jgi:hypothetical protein